MMLGFVPHPNLRAFSALFWLSLLIWSSEDCWWVGEEKS
jgi:hypothetical protein